ncbi:MAG: FixH family protein [Gemmatirosa sp.]
MKRGTLWPLAIGTVLVATMGINFWVLQIAGSDPSAVVEPDYYRKAIAYDTEMAQARTNVALGWTLAPTLAPVGPARRARLVVALHDRDGRPLDGARVTVEGFAIARSATVVGAALAPRGDGRYEASLPVATTGRWELRFAVQRGVERFTADARLDAVPAVATAAR